MARPKLVQRLAAIEQYCSGKSVLHLGCTNYPYTEDSLRDGILLHAKLSEIAGEVFGFDADERGLEILRDRGFKDLYQADLERLDGVKLDRTFDVILAGEMIEHLNNPGLFLAGIKRFMGPDTRLMITTVNAYCAMRNFQYAVSRSRGSREPVHPDHVAYYSYATLTELLRRHDIEVEEFMFYDLGAEHRPFASRLQKIVNDVGVRISPQLADGVIAIGRLAATPK